MAAGSRCEPKCDFRPRQVKRCPSNSTTRSSGQKTAKPQLCSCPACSAATQEMGTADRNGRKRRQSRLLSGAEFVGAAQRRSGPSRDQQSRWRARGLFRGPERPPARGHHASLRQQRLGAIGRAGSSRSRVSAVRCAVPRAQVLPSAWHPPGQSMGPPTVRTI